MASSRKSLGSTKLSFPMVAVIAIGGIAVAVYGFMQTKKAKRAQYAFEQTLPQWRILKPIIDSATSADISYTLGNASNDDGMLPQGPYGGALKARGNPLALHGMASWDRSGRMGNTPISVNITVPSPERIHPIIASANCRGDSSSGGVAIGYRPH